MHSNTAHLNQDNALSAQKHKPHQITGATPFNLPQVRKTGTPEVIIAYGEWGNAVTISVREAQTLCDHLKNPKTAKRVGAFFLDKLEKMAHVRITWNKGPNPARFEKSFLPVVMRLLEADEHIERHSAVVDTVAAQAPAQWKLLCVKREYLKTRQGQKQFAKTRAKNGQTVPAIGVKGFKKTIWEKLQETLSATPTKVAGYAMGNHHIKSRGRSMQPILLIQRKQLSR